MKTVEAVEELSGILSLRDLGGDDEAQDLIDWFNTAQPDQDEISRLARLQQDGKFQAWDCPQCDERVYEGQPDDWSHFQGVVQNDRTSYPGTGSDDRRCDHCRCHMVGETRCAT